MLFIPSILDLDPELCCGTWTREQLVEMDSRFRAAVEQAFAQGLESRAVAAATVRIGRNGKEAEAAIEAGWGELCRNNGDISFVEIVQFVRKRCLVDPALIRAGFARRFKQHGREPWASEERGEMAAQEREEPL